MNTPTIPRDPIYRASQDFQRLRREGIQHIERFGSDLWTDYNLHDPGITILEVLCYALTDLGYRTDLPMRDLLATTGGNGVPKPFFTAREILASEPVTANDYRKLLIDIDGVKNAWVGQNKGEGVFFQLKFEDHNKKAFNTALLSIIERYKDRLKIYDPSYEFNSEAFFVQGLNLNFQSLIDAIKELNHCPKCGEKLNAEKKLCKEISTIKSNIFDFIKNHFSQTIFRAFVLDNLSFLFEILDKFLKESFLNEIFKEKTLRICLLALQDDNIEIIITEQKEIAARLDQLTNNLKNLNREYREKLAEQRDKQIEIGGLSADIQDSKGKIVEFEQEKEDITKNIKEKENEREVLKDGIHVVTEDLEKLKEDINSAKQELAEKENDLKLKSKSIKELEKGIKDLDKSIKDTSDKIDQINTEIAKPNITEAEKEVLIKEQDTQKLTIIEKEETKAIKQEAIASGKADQKKLEHELNQLKLRIEQLDRNLEEKEKELQEISKALARIEKELEELNKELKFVEEKLQNEKDNLNGILNKIESLKKELNDLGYVLNSLNSNIKFIRDEKTQIDKYKDELIKLGDNWNTAWDFFKDNIGITTNKLQVQFYNIFIEPLYQLLLNKSIVLTEQLDGAPNSNNYSVFTINGIYNFYLELDDDVPTTDARVPGIVEEAWRRLYAHRNLGEDYAQITVVEEEPIGMCANIELMPEADPSDVLARIYDAIGEYLSPTIPFYSLEEMLDRRSFFVLNEAFFESLVEAVVPQKLIDALKPLKDNPIEGKEKLKNSIKQQKIEDALLEEYQAFILEKAVRQDNSDSIFEGPMLENGFLEEEDLERANLRQTVYKSDIYQEIMKVTGVRSIASLEIGKCERQDGKLPKIFFDKDNEWCISLDCICKPVLDLECTKIYFSTGGNYFSPNPDWVQERLAIIKAGKKKPKPSSPIDIAVPRGTFRSDLTEWTSIQEDFPNTYKVGRYGIASNETPLRKAQAKQLKGYLLFFDQIMANHLAQLGALRNLLAVKRNEEESLRSFQPLYDVPNVKDLLVDFNPEQETWEKFKDRTHYIKILEKIIPLKDVYDVKKWLAKFAPEEQTWEDFTAKNNNKYREALMKALSGYEMPQVIDLLANFDPEKETWGQLKNKLENEYIKSLQGLTFNVPNLDGDKIENADIKSLLSFNKILDHLLARYGEQFADHVSELYKIERPTDKKTAFEQTLLDLLRNKKRLLGEVDIIGRERARAFNYRPGAKDNGEPDIWETDNVEGLKKRVAGFLGFTNSERNRINYQRRTITCMPNFQVVTFQIPRSQPRFYNFGIKENSNDTQYLMKGARPYQNRKTATTESQRFFDLAAYKDWYGLVQNPTTKGWVAAFWENPPAEVQNRIYEDAFLISEEFTEQADAGFLLSSVLRLIDSNCEDEGFHIIEHVLLRPKDQYYNLLTLNCMPPCQLDRMDPYSFWITVIVPEWVNRFREDGGLYRFEQLLRQEAPAHIAVRICTLNSKAMYEFETAYYDWLYKNAVKDSTPSELRDAVNRIVELLNSNDKNCRSVRAKLPEPISCE